MAYHRHDIEPKCLYKIGDVAKEAKCTPSWIRQLCKSFKIKVKRNASNNNRMFTEEQKDSLVKLRWMYADFEKCVEYCWKNGINPL